ncbi:MAG: DNA mismatch repair protein MutS [Thermincola sp.]|nr:DNA mismatch repair protein MutS [Thermincola sp.]MDT3704662.1 DNA mismatch repair protein MutS [Thermincola sp.]
MTALTPMMKQYMAIKEENPGSILFFRLGDFYEMFLDDAETASRVLEITLTARDGGNGTKIPMCGVPHHAADSYIAKLIEKGYRVAICEQVEDPRTAKGIVKREVTRVITPGTVTDGSMLDEGNYNFLLSIVKDELGYGIGVAEITTGYFAVTEITGARALAKLTDEIARLKPVECIMPDELSDNKELCARLSGQNIAVSYFPTQAFTSKNAYGALTQHFGTSSLEGFGCENLKLGQRAAGGVLAFLKDTQKNALTHFNRLLPYTTENFMLLDNATRRNLELTQTLRDHQKKGSLLWVLDSTVTAMGARQLKVWVEQPLLDIAEINSRLDSVEELVNNVFLRNDLQSLLNKVYDLERLAGRIAYGNANARDMVALKNSLEIMPGLQLLLEDAHSPGLRAITEALDSMEDIVTLIDLAVSEEPPLSVRDGGIIKKGYNDEVDRLRTASKEGKGWIAALEAKEKERTGIKSLKVGFNKVFGYYIEITNANLGIAPDDYTRKQTLANAERFVTPALKEYENMILGAEDRVIQLEYELFCDLRNRVNLEVPRIQRCAAMLARLDVLQSLAEAAIKNNYTKPVVNERDILEIKEGRHPVVEKVLAGETFVPNDTYLDGAENRLDMITGPNMAGKSTYMRQVALICLLAQIGSFVPAEQAVTGVVDRIFTRVGASDDLATGQSTFMVEMNEVANILNNATAKSLVVLDEIGRGTSTFDGLSIAWAVAEYILDNRKIGAKTLFATHYHELTELADIFPGVQNHSVAVREKGEDIIFLRKIVPGGADRSYGIQVARLAGLPNEVLIRAGEILVTLEATEDLAKGRRETAAAKRQHIPQEQAQLSFFAGPEKLHPVEEELAALDLLNLTPIDALNVLYRLQKKLKELK